MFDDNEIQNDCFYCLQNGSEVKTPDSVITLYIIGIVVVLWALCVVFW